MEFVEREERGETTFEGVLVGCANPARARNEATRRGAMRASGGESCRGDAYAGCVVTNDGVSARFVRAGAPWGDSSSVARVTLGTSDVDAVASKVVQTMGPDASTQARGVFKQFGVTEFAAEDERVESASTFVSYSTKASPAIEISKGRTSPC